MEVPKSHRSCQVRARLEVVCGDVLATPAPGAAADGFDVICANNYSHQCLRTRELMLAYLAGARAGLAAGGVFVLDLCGGPDCEQNSYEPLAFAECGRAGGRGCHAVL
jgi:hypothetical protein